MAIDPAVLHRQKAAIYRSSPERILRIVDGQGWHGAIRPPSCECGSCRKCRNREWMRQYREANPKPASQHLGPRIDPDRKCYVCRGPVSVVNRHGVCIRCSRHLSHRKILRIAKYLGFFSQGGGI